MIEMLHIVLAMKPLDGNFVKNALEYGVAGLNIDAGRITTADVLQGGAGGLLSNVRDAKDYPDDNGYVSSPDGRWPANIIHDGSKKVVSRFPETGLSKATAGGRRNSGSVYGIYKGFDELQEVGYGDQGSAARFFKECKLDND